MDLSKIATDRKLSTEGRWERPWNDSTELLIARTGNPRYEEELQKAVRPFRNAIRRNQLSPEQNLRIMNKVLARTVLLDWKELYEAGQMVPYSSDEAERMLTDYPDFRDIVVDYADDYSRFQEEDVEEAGKSSETD